MSEKSQSNMGVNSWLEEELRQEFLHDPAGVDESWKSLLKRNGSPAPQPTNGADAPAPEAAAAQVSAPRQPAVAPASGDELVPLRGAALRIAENMSLSLAVPTATSQRSIAVKLIDENRRITNLHRSVLGQSKLSYTHFIAWAIVRALQKFPALNDAYSEQDGQPHRVRRAQINFGLAVDVPGKDGTRSLLVPNIKDAGMMSFREFLEAYDALVAKARSNKLAVPDFQGTSISLTNPGTVGTVGSVPRLMPGQGAIIATGAIDFPAEYQGVSPSIRSALGISKVMLMTCTYDHRIIQGAESGTFLGYIAELLQGGHGFYDDIFDELSIPYQPARFEPDRQPDAASRYSGIDAAKQAAVTLLINMYRVRGHLMADLDPLGRKPSAHPELDPSNFGLTIWDLDREYLTGTLARPEGAEPTATLREIIDILRQTYCGRVGCEYMHIQHPEEKAWLQSRMEPAGNAWTIEKPRRSRTLERLLEAESFEQFLHARFVGHKRFSLEGAETAIAILDEIVERAAATGVHEIVIGMAHRGRLNVLSNLVGKPLEQVFSEFEGNIDPASTQGSGDVKYHLGASGTHVASTGHEIRVSVSPNPSHLEAVDPVVEGIVRPKQDRLGDTERARVIPLLVHGDAAFAGQGVVAETLNLSQLEGYRTGGTIHLIINNQIGFTTRPDEARSMTHPSDVARMVQAPIFHVNGDDPDAAVRAAQLALEYRQAFKKDVVIDMICYRRHGHNEGDDPSYTQPIMYRKIRQHPSVATQYTERLKREKLVTSEEIAAVRQRIALRFEEGYRKAQESREHFRGEELSAVPGEEITPVSPHTAIDEALASRVVEGITSFPADFRLNPKLKGFIDKRKEALRGAPVDWALAEAIAFGSLVIEGTPVRLSGQDSSRGTFSQRHLEFYDFEDGHMYIPMSHLDPAQGRFDVVDSSLSEYAVMGFEFGYSVGDPTTLVMWEAQFGDFVNGAQIMIDQFISAAESKWGQPSGLVLLLPHGYEGQGPEHSSARVERFLQLCAEENMLVVNCTTPGQYFHVLRRQMHGGHDRRGMRKPLIVFTPKSLLRHPKAVSIISEFTSGGFREILPDQTVDPASAARVLFCSGKIYYDLAAAREERRINNVAIVRVEQLYPLVCGQLESIIASYPATAELVWVQEEPRNMGAWTYFQEAARGVAENSKRQFRYIGRSESASPSAGSLKRHTQEQTEIIDESFAPGPVQKKPKPARRRR